MMCTKLSMKGKKNVMFKKRIPDRRYIFEKKVFNRSFRRNTYYYLNFIPKYLIRKK